MIIITGAAGFIGSALAWRLNSLGRSDLLLVDNLGTSAKWRNLVPLRYHDYLEKQPFLEALQGGAFDGESIDALFHLGACSSTTENDASYLVRNNFEYSKALAHFCAVRNIRLVYASSAATYGDGDAGYIDDHACINSLRPLNMYGYSKHAFDLWNLQRGLLTRFVGLKYFNVYGPNEYHKGDMKSMVAKAYSQIQATGGVRLFRSHREGYGDGQQLRDFLYVKDAVDMTLFFLDEKAPGGIYNIGTGVARSWNDMMLALFAAMGREPCIEYVDMPEALRGKYQYYTQAEMGKLREAGYRKSASTLEEGVRDYAAYLKDGERVLGHIAE